MSWTSWVLLITCVPVTSCQISPHLVIRFCILEYSHVQINDSHAFRVAAEPRQRSSIWYANLREAGVAFTSWSTGVREDDG